MFFQKLSENVVSLLPSSQIIRGTFLESYFDGLRCITYYLNQLWGGCIHFGLRFGHMLKPHFFKKVINLGLFDDRQIIDEGLIGIFLFSMFDSIYKCRVRFIDVLPW